jgi:hypothetical protein
MPRYGVSWRIVRHAAVGRIGSSGGLGRATSPAYGSRADQPTASCLRIRGPRRLARTWELCEFRMVRDNRCAIEGRIASE